VAVDSVIVPIARVAVPAVPYPDGHINPGE